MGPSLQTIATIFAVAMATGVLGVRVQFLNHRYNLCFGIAGGSQEGKQAAFYACNATDPTQIWEIGPEGEANSTRGTVWHTVWQPVPGQPKVLTTEGTADCFVRGEVAGEKQRWYVRRYMDDIFQIKDSVSGRCVQRTGTFHNVAMAHTDCTTSYMNTWFYVLPIHDENSAANSAQNFASDLGPSDDQELKEQMNFLIKGHMYGTYIGVNSSVEGAQLTQITGWDWDPSNPDSNPNLNQVFQIGNWNAMKNGTYLVPLGQTNYNWTEPLLVVTRHEDNRTLSLQPKDDALFARQTWHITRESPSSGYVNRFKFRSPYSYCIRTWNQPEIQLEYCQIPQNRYDQWILEQVPIWVDGQTRNIVWNV